MARELSSVDGALFPEGFGEQFTLERAEWALFWWPLLDADSWYEALGVLMAERAPA